MNLIIHRGTNEIGGSCVELQSGNSRILLDIGMPLVNAKGNRFDFNKYKNLSPSELLKQGILPEISGAYFEKPEIDALLISHSHADHYGLMGYIPDTIPLIEETIPKIVQQLITDRVDAVILNPG